MSAITHCPACTAVLPLEALGSRDAITCPSCRHRIDPAPQGATEPLMARMSAHISRAAGVQQLEGFSLRDTFSEVFAKHSEEEVERYFAVGGPDTTPALADIDTRWPRPWVFFRMFMLAVITYFCFVQAWNQFENVKLLPGLIIVGSFAVPFATLILFFEFNLRRNVSLFQTAKFVILGGVLSIILSLLLYQLTDQMHTQWLGDSIAGLVEEPCKLLVLALVVNNSKYRHILNGLLFGAAVGAGFAAFESAGYALLAAQDSSQAMRDSIFHRGVLSPAGHIVWTAMSAAALWRVKGKRRFELGMLNDMRFKRVFIAAVVLHMLWDSNLVLPFDLQFVIYGVIAWVIVLGLTQEGIAELRIEQAAASAAAAASATSAPAPAAP